MFRTTRKQSPQKAESSALAKWEEVAYFLLGTVLGPIVVWGAKKGALPAWVDLLHYAVLLVGLGAGSVLVIRKLFRGRPPERRPLIAVLVCVGWMVGVKLFLQLSTNGHA